MIENVEQVQEQLVALRGDVASTAGTTTLNRDQSMKLSEFTY